MRSSTIHLVSMIIDGNIEDEILSNGMVVEYVLLKLFRKSATVFQVQTEGE